jgi:ABC-type antimicrobial peptide transport system permease subunit
LIENTLLRERLLALIAGFLSLVATGLAAIGLYGMLSYSVGRRTKEIGIRVALGARNLGVVWLMISYFAPMFAVGLVAGIAGGFALTRFVSSLLFEVKPSDFWSLALPIVCLLLTACVSEVSPV